MSKNIIKSLEKIRERIKDLRVFSDYTLEEFAKKLGISTDEYLEYESGQKSMSIGMLYSIAGALMIDPGVLLTGEDPKDKDVAVIYNGKGREITRYDGYSFSSLNNSFVDAAFEPMLVTIKEGVLPELVRHGGEEFNYVIDGKLRVIVNEKDYYLTKGDSIYFDATFPHAQVAMTTVARFLTVIQKL
ncbi:MAG: XRE family transcriptional regulator [Christensenellaceae bacterium]|jgi:transcriptional regulator with XRE-family HTH domain|nr:XRE family transcriptional regulator [Christensenellaceae bacterium]